MERYTKEQTFEKIDEKLKPILKDIPKEQQIDMEEFYMIFTRSNELIHVVDCRSQEEYDSCHISNSHRLDYWEQKDFWGKIPIRTFYYSRIGERSAAIVQEEAKKGIKAYTINGGLIEWLHYNGYCDSADNSNNVDVVDKEYAPMVPEKYNPIFKN